MHDVLRQFIRRVLIEGDDNDTSLTGWMIIGSSNDKQELRVAGRMIKRKWGDRFKLEIAPSPTLPHGYDLRLRHN